MKVDFDLDIERKTFASGLLSELIAVLQRSRPGDLVAVIGDEASIGPELETWCRFTGNSLLETTVEKGRMRWVFRCGPVAKPAEYDRPLTSRLWLYTNFDCNLRCDYCCVRSSPTAPRRELGLERVKRITHEAVQLGVMQIFVTGGEPFLPGRHRRDSGLLRCSRSDHRAHQRNVILRGALRKPLRALAP